MAAVLGNHARSLLSSMRRYTAAARSRRWIPDLVQQRRIPSDPVWVPSIDIQLRVSKQSIEEHYTLCMWTMRLHIHRPRPEPPTTTTRSASEYILSLIGRTSPLPTSSLQSIPVELRELSKHPALVLVLDTHSGIRHIHSKEADGVHPNLISGIVRHDIIGAASLETNDSVHTREMMLFSFAGLRNSVEHLTFTVPLVGVNLT